VQLFQVVMNDRNNLPTYNSFLRSFIFDLY
jgi:hypothetical protein